MVTNHLTKTEAKILQFFVGHVTELYTIRSIGKQLRMNHSLAHRAITSLKDKKLISATKQHLLTLNYRSHHETLTYAEYLRRDAFLSRPSQGDLALCLNDFVDKSEEESFALLIFGSAVISSKPRDIDILIIVDDVKKIESTERTFHNLARNYGLNTHTVVISYESVYEMLSRREETNVMNELLNKHIIIYGAELFYRLLKRGRK